MSAVDNLPDPWHNIDLERDSAALGIAHVIWFFLETGRTDEAVLIEQEFGVTL